MFCLIYQIVIANGVPDQIRDRLREKVKRCVQMFRRGLSFIRREARYFRRTWTRRIKRERFFHSYPERMESFFHGEEGGRISGSSLNVVGYISRFCNPIVNMDYIVQQ